MTKRKSSVAPYPRKRLPGRQYPGVRGKVVDYISHSIADGTLCINVSFQKPALLGESDHSKALLLPMRSVYQSSPRLVHLPVR